MSYSINSPIHPTLPLRRQLSRPVLEEVMKPWIEAKRSARFQAFLLPFDEDSVTLLEEGRDALDEFLEAMSLYGLGHAACRAGERLGSAVIREATGDSGEFWYSLLLETPPSANLEFVSVAHDLWSRNHADIEYSLKPIGSVQAWITYLLKCDRPKPSYIDSLETWAWRVPRGWALPPTQGLPDDPTVPSIAGEVPPLQ